MKFNDGRGTGHGVAGSNLLTGNVALATTTYVSLHSVNGK